MNNSEKYFDVVICGAGPAGSTCALALSGSNLKVAIVDKSSFPRDKVCGDAIASYTRQVLNSINLKFATAFDQFEKRYLVNTYRLFGPNGKYIDVNWEKPGMIAKRFDWDHFLYSLAIDQPNVTSFTNAAITNVQRHNDLIQIRVGEDVLQTKLVIGCDGAHSIVARDLVGHTKDLHHHSAAVRAYYKNIAGIQNQTFELHYIDGILPGYFWIFPLPDNMANVGLGCSSELVSQNKMNLRKTLTSILKDHPQIRERFKNSEQLSDIEGFGLPLGSRKVKMSGDHFMLCGDAASLIDPLTGEGIGPAMVSGRYAGWHAIKCFQKNDFSPSFMKQYDQQVHAKFWKDYRKRYYIQRLIISKPKVVNGLIGLASRSKMVHGLLSKVFL